MKLPRGLRLLALVSASAAVAFCGASAGTGLGTAAPQAFFVSPAGSPSGDGSREKPWDLQTALNQPAAVHPGDTIWLRDGTYQGVFTSQLRGAADSPIIVRQYPWEHARLDGGSSGQTKAILAIAGEYTWYWGFEIMSSDPRRLSIQAGSAPTDMYRPDAIQTVQDSSTGSGLRFINLVIHDTRQGVSYWKEAVDSEVYGCLIYYNGWQGTDRAHGHGVYTQNETGTKRIADNVIFKQFGGGIQAYGSSAAHLNNFRLEGNASFENGALSTMDASDNLLVGGGVVTNNDTISSNMLYYDDVGDTPARAFNFGYTSGCSNGVVKDNYVAANAYFGNCTPTEMTGNTFGGAVDGIAVTQYPANAYAAAPPAAARIFVRPNEYEAGRANIIVFNWGLQASLDVDLSGVLSAGQAYEIRDVHDFFGAPIVTGIYDGAPVSLPMTGLPVSAPVGWPAPPPSGPQFNAFVVLPARSARENPRLPAPAAPRAPRAHSRAAAEAAADVP